MQFDMNRTWEQAIRLVRKNFQLLALIAGVFMLLPSVLFYVAFPDILAMMAVTTDAEAMEAQMRAVLPQFLAFGLVAMLVQMVGYMAMIALMGGDRPTVGESIARGAKGLPALIAAVIIFAIGYVVATVVLSLVLGLVAGLFGMESEGAAAGMGAFLSIVILVATLYIMVRFCLTLPIIVLEQAGPLKALARSWRLTRPRAWAIFGFFALLFIAYMVISMLLVIVFGAFGFVAGEQVGGGTVLGLGLLTGVIGALAAMLLSGILVSMHGQLSGGSPPPDVEYNI